MIYTLEAQIAAVLREIALRERAYPRWVANAKMKPEKAVLELGAMKAVLKTLESLQEETFTSLPQPWVAGRPVQRPRR